MILFNCYCPPTIIDLGIVDVSTGETTSHCVLRSALGCSSYTDISYPDTRNEWYSSTRLANETQVRTLTRRYSVYYSLLGLLRKTDRGRTNKIRKNGFFSIHHIHTRTRSTSFSHGQNNKQIFFSLFSDNFIEMSLATF